MYKIKTTEKQKKAVNGILQGKNARQSMLDAGYSEKSSNNPKLNLMERTGVSVYLKKFDRASKRKFGMNLQDKLIDTFTDGLEATKLFGKNAVKHPDHGTRFIYASKLSELLGWSKQIEVPNVENNQFNYFQISKEESQQFHNKLKDFLKKGYKTNEGVGA